MSKTGGAMSFQDLVMRASETNRVLVHVSDSCIGVIVPGSNAITYRIVISGNIEVIPLKEYNHGFNYYIIPESFIVFSPYKPVGLNS